MSAAEYEAYQLYALGEAGVTHIRLRASTRSDSPAACTETDGFAMTLEEAMRLQPIPHEVAPGDVCRCSYRPTHR